MEFKDYYNILGVKPDAEAGDIRAAYRKLARRYHPDVSDHEEAEQKFKEVAEAWQVLKDPDKRAEYDHLRATGGRQAAGGGYQPPPGWRQGTVDGADMGSGFSDFFEEIFGHGRQGARFTGGFHARGQDIEMELPVFLEELLNDEQRQIAYKVPVIGADGQRQADREKTLKVRIPAGVGDGEVIRLKGQGAPGIGDGPGGDLYLRIRLVPHPMFDVEGSNLLLTLPMAPWEAAMGTRIQIPTLEGDIQLTVPANTQTGKRLRIRGKGLPGAKGRGDLLVIPKVVMPEQNDALAEHWRTLSETAGFDARATWRKQ